MFDSIRSKEWLHVVRAHTCSLALAVSFNGTWRVPRDAFRYGGLSFALAYSFAMAAVALPITLLQLTVGQLCQQDAVGMWRAVPLFKGLGYLRLLVSMMGSIYTVIYVALSLVYFLYTVSNSTPFPACEENYSTPDDFELEILNSSSSSSCLNGTFLAPVAEQPEYYLATILILAALWIALPFVFYTPVKTMRRMFYAVTPVILILMIVIVSNIGVGSDISLFIRSSNWQNFVRPKIWHAALIQALWSSQVAGGYLVSAGDTVYMNTNAQWSAIIIVGINVVISWVGLVFWFSIGGSGDRDTSAIAVLVQIYHMTEERSLSPEWPALTFAMLFLSGIISMIVLLYPLYERFRMLGALKWLVIALNSLVGGAVALLVLVEGMPALDLLEDVAVPLLISLTTVLEICVFIFIYGWKSLKEDVEFLTGQKLRKIWVMGWCAAPGVIAPFTVWWLVDMVRGATEWTKPPWETATVVATAAFAALIIVVFAAIAVAKQLQYNLLGNLKSSFKPSRHWGPRDPITHYYWLARREEANSGLPRSVHQRRQLGQLSGRINFLSYSSTPDSTKSSHYEGTKKRANSDDWLYTVYRKEFLELALREMAEKDRHRSKSLDLTIVPNSVKVRSIDSATNSSKYITPDESISSKKGRKNKKIVSFKEVKF